MTDENTSQEESTEEKDPIERLADQKDESPAQPTTLAPGVHDTPPDLEIGTSEELSGDGFDTSVLDNPAPSTDTTPDNAS